MPSPLLNGLLHRWPLTETAGDRADTVGNLPFLQSGNVGGAGGFVGPSPGAADFDGNYDNCLSIPFDTAHDLRFDTSFTLSAWYYQAATQAATVAIFSQGRWYQDFNLSLLSNSGHLQFALDQTDAGKSVDASNIFSGAGWFFICLRHDAATKRFSAFVVPASGSKQTYIEKVYSGDLTRSTMPIRLHGLPLSGQSVPAVGPFHLQELSFWNRSISDDEQLALWNAGRGDLYPYNVAYPQTGAIPTRDTSTRDALIGLDVAVSATGFSPSHPSETARILIHPALAVAQAQFEFVNAQADNSAGEQTHLDATSGGAISIAGATYYLPYREQTTIPLTFNGGQNGVTLNYGQRVLCDPIAPALYAGEPVYVSTYFHLESGFSKVPQRFQLTGSGMGVAGGGDKSASIDNADFSNPPGVDYTFGPTMIKGKTFGPATLRDRDLTLRGDSIAANTGTFYYALIANSGVKATTLALAGEAAHYLSSSPTRDTSRTALVHDHDRLIDEYGTNDLRATSRTFAQLKADKAALWTRWLGGDSQVRSLVTVTLMPLTEGSAENQAGVSLNRAPWNTFLRSGADNGQISLMTGRPTLVYRWNGAAWATSGPRGEVTSGAVSGQPLDFYVLDSAAFFETDHIGNSNTWNTVPAPGKIVASAATISDGIHPYPSDAAAAAALAQPRFDAWLAAPLPALDFVGPVVTAAQVAENGTSLTLTFSEAALGSGGFTVRVGGISRGFTITGSGNTRLLELADPVGGGQSVTLDYTPGDLTDGDLNEGDVTDGAGNAALAFTARVVANASGIDITPPPPPAVFATLSGSDAQLTFAVSSDTATIEVQRDGNALTRLTPPRDRIATYTDSTLSPGTTYTYTAQSRDATGNPSPWSAPARVQTPSPDKVRLTFSYGNGAQGESGTFHFRLTPMGAPSTQTALWHHGQLQDAAASHLVTTGGDGLGEVSLPPAPAGARWVVQPPSGGEFAIDVKAADLGKVVRLEEVVV